MTFGRIVRQLNPRRLTESGFRHGVAISRWWSWCHL